MTRYFGILEMTEAGDKTHAVSLHGYSVGAVAVVNDQVYAQFRSGDTEPYATRRAAVQALADAGFGDEYELAPFDVVYTELDKPAVTKVDVAGAHVGFFFEAAPESFITYPVGGGTGPMAESRGDAIDTLIELFFDTDPSA